MKMKRSHARLIVERNGQYLHHAEGGRPVWHWSAYEAWWDQSGGRYALKVAARVGGTVKDFNPITGRIKRRDYSMKLVDLLEKMDADSFLIVFDDEADTEDEADALYNGIVDDIGILEESELHALENAPVVLITPTELETVAGAVLEVVVHL